MAVIKLTTSTLKNRKACQNVRHFKKRSVSYGFKINFHNEPARSQRYSKLIVELFLFELIRFLRLL